MEKLEKLNETQKYMIERISFVIDETTKRIKDLEEKSNKTIRETETLYNLKSKLKQLEKQLMIAKKPFNRTTEEINTINKLVDGIKIEVDGVERSSKMKEEKTSKVKIPTGKELFEKQLNEYISNVNQALEDIELSEKVQKFIIGAVEDKLNMGTKNIEGEVEESIKKIVEQNKKTLEELISKEKLYKVILKMAKNKFGTKLLEQYDDLKLIDVYLNGVFNFSEKDKTILSLIKRYKI